MIQLKTDLKPADLQPALKDFWNLSGQKIRLIRDRSDHTKGSPVFTEAYHCHRRWKCNGFCKRMRNLK